MSKEQCLFCDIVSGALPTEKVAENGQALAFRDRSPQAPVHLLVIPREHQPTIAELAEGSPALASAVLVMARQVAEQEGIGDGYRLVCNNGAAAQQTVFHAHVHVLGGREFTWPPG